MFKNGATEKYIIIEKKNLGKKLVYRVVRLSLLFAELEKFSSFRYKVLQNFQHLKSEFSYKIRIQTYIFLV